MAGEDELKALLIKPQAGMCAIHVHLGRLDNPAVYDRKVMRGILRDLGKKSDSWRLFDIANGDLLMLYRGVAFAAVEAACREIAGLLVESRLGGRSPYPDGSAPPGPTYHILELSSNAAHLLHYLESVTTGGDAPPRH